jgi:NAD(P)-dependent dehydrogenase (short-subunit alcohol dehydrogenase family)
MLPAMRPPEPAVAAVPAADRWSLHGRVALVTGAGRGLGLACARALAEAGAAVLLVARTADEVEAGAAAIVAAGGVAGAHVADVTDESQMAGIVAAADELGELGVCVAAAGTNRPGPARDYPTADWDALFAVNVRATFLLCRAVGDALIERGARGSIVTMSSQMGTVGYPGRVAYCATKHAVEGLTKALGVEWAPHGIRVNAVAPTFVRTPLTESMLADPAFAEEVRRRLPTGELATAEQVADAVRYLACDASTSVTGSVLRVDGGWTAW